MRGSKFSCRASLIEPAVRFLVVADLADPENLQNLIIGASVLAATSASLYYGLKANPPSTLSQLISSSNFHLNFSKWCSILATERRGRFFWEF